MRKSWIIWVIFLACLGIGAAAMWRVSSAVLRLERMESDARRQAQLEENVRLALWRMDSFLGPLVATESARPWTNYTAFAPADRAYNPTFNRYRAGDVLLPSPLLGYDSALVKLHFQIGPNGALSSPQAPTGNMRDVASEMRFASRMQMTSAEQSLRRVQVLVPQKTILACIEAALPSGDFTAATQPIQLQQRLEAVSSPAQQSAKSQVEFGSRSQNFAAIANSSVNDNRQFAGNLYESPVDSGVMRPFWQGGELFMARTVATDSGQYIQGCWMNWPEMSRLLLEQVSDLLPEARLEPAGTRDGQRDARLLATIPVRLSPGGVTAMALPQRSPLKLTLAAAWGAFAAATLAVGLLLWGAMALSARRGAFVSAVTHELRTPLTTVSMYAEMLEQGMVSDEQRRGEYLRTLRAEADRLGRLVENVLAYSRIERGSSTARLETLLLPPLLESASARASQRAQGAGMSLSIEIDPSAEAAHVRADATAVEQIIFNLIDNACKYAARSSDQRIHLRASIDGTSARISVSDHGPGVDGAYLRRLFRPFSRAATEAAGNAPGVGLGLALCRRLARQMRGELSYERGDAGACFVLTLPRVAPQSLP